MKSTRGTIFAYFSLFGKLFLRPADFGTCKTLSRGRITHSSMELRGGDGLALPLAMPQYRVSRKTKAILEIY